VAFDEAGIAARLRDLGRPCYVVRDGSRLGITGEGHAIALGPGAAGAAVSSGTAPCLAEVPPIACERLGDPSFGAFHGVRWAYAAGAMANGIASEGLVIALGREGLLSAFGAAGLLPRRVEEAIVRLQQALPQGPYAFNLIHSPSEDALERAAVELYLAHRVTTVEASAFLELTPHLVRYRVAGLRRGADGEIACAHRVIAKVSRPEVAARFLGPPPAPLLRQLVAAGHVTEQQAAMAARVPMCDDLTVEADSGGHTDNRPLVCLLPAMIELRDRMQEEHGFAVPVRVGAAGGISTPAAALAAFAMGAAYVVTGSVNQSCVEAGASAQTKTLLAQAGPADVAMAPAADMFELGVRVQVLKRGTLFPMRAQRLYDLYRTSAGIEEIPTPERERLERQVFRRSLDDVWRDTLAFFSERDPAQLARAAGNPKRRMALIFRWYLGLSSRWSNDGEPGREVDYQIWCGPSMGAFNEWVRGTYLERPEARRVVDVATHIMRGAAFLARVQALSIQGVQLPARLRRYRPAPLDA
jgi:PfaD family protein